MQLQHALSPHTSTETGRAGQIIRDDSAVCSGAGRTEGGPPRVSLQASGSNEVIYGHRGSPKGQPGGHPGVIWEFRVIRSRSYHARPPGLGIISSGIPCRNRGQRWLNVYDLDAKMSQKYAYGTLLEYGGLQYVDIIQLNVTS